MSKSVLCVVHNRHSRPGQVAEALEAKGWRIETCCPRAGEPLPDPADHAGVVIFGGPMSANDDHLDFVRRELDWIPGVLDAGTPFFGICLGAQMLARCLGAAVVPHPEGLHEIGYYRIAPTPLADGFLAEPLHVFHWHGEGFELPEGAELLATGDTFHAQAYRYGEAAYGVQFHPEIQLDILEFWMKAAAHKLGSPGAQPPGGQLAGHARHGPEMHRWLDGFIDSWLARHEPAHSNR